MLRREQGPIKGKKGGLRREPWERRSEGNLKVDRGSAGRWLRRIKGAGLRRTKSWGGKNHVRQSLVI